MHAFLHGLSACLNQKEHRQVNKLKRNDSGVGHPRWEKKKTSPTVQPSEVVFLYQILLFILGSFSHNHY